MADKFITTIVRIPVDDLEALANWAKTRREAFQKEKESQVQVAPPTVLTKVGSGIAIPQRHDRSLREWKIGPEEEPFHYRARTTADYQRRLDSYAKRTTKVKKEERKLHRPKKKQTTLTPRKG